MSEYSQAPPAPSASRATCSLLRATRAEASCWAAASASRRSSQWPKDWRKSMRRLNSIIVGAQDRGRLSSTGFRPRISPNRRIFFDDGPEEQRLDVNAILASPSADTHLYAGSVAKIRSEEHTSELQSLMRISYAVFCLNKK